VLSVHVAHLSMIACMVRVYSLSATVWAKYMADNSPVFSREGAVAMNSPMSVVPDRGQPRTKTGRMLSLCVLDILYCIVLCGGVYKTKVWWMYFLLRDKIEEGRMRN